MDTFKNQASSLEAPARDGATLTPSDSAPIAVMTRAVYVGTGGDLRVEMAGGQELTFANVQGGTFLPLRITRLFQTGTNAGGVVGIW